MPFKDPEKNREARRNWYANNPEKVINYKNKREAKNREWIDSLKKPCSHCGFFHPAVIDFHHIDKDQKKIGISKLVKAGWSREKMLEEIKKCICLCSNCHRIEHWKEKHGSLV